MKNKNMTQSQSASVAAKAKWNTSREKTIESLKDGWKGRKERIRAKGIKDSAFTMEERRSFSMAKLQKSGNLAMLYLRDLGISPNRKDGLHKAVRKMIVNEYKDPINFFLQFLNVIDKTIKEDVRVDVWHLMEEINRSRIANEKQVYNYSGELSKISKGYGKRIRN